MIDPPAAMAARMSGGPLPLYRAQIRNGALQPDASQAAAIERLHMLWEKLRGYDPPPRPRFAISRLLRWRPTEGADPARPNGLYLVGDVGRGKSMLMDLFFETAEMPRKRRVHFHAFMQEAHARIQRWRNTNPEGADPIPPLADSIAAESALLCFDEFQINDITDALILGRLFEALFARGVIVVATSNTAPDDLFRGRPGRDAFLPFIEMLKQRLDILVVAGDRDYRRNRLIEVGLWHVPAGARADAALDAAFHALSGGIAPAPCTLHVLGRRLSVPMAAGAVARFDFKHLCGAALGPADYLALATHFETLVLDAVPRLSPDNFDEARRFITLIDALYEHRVKLVASADATPDTLYRRGEGADAFERTASRLQEMQSEAYLALPHLT